MSDDKIETIDTDTAKVIGGNSGPMMAVQTINSSGTTDNEASNCDALKTLKSSSSTKPAGPVKAGSRKS